MNVIGIDIGGTSIKGACITEEGKFLATLTSEVIKGEPAEVTINRLIFNINKMISDNNLDKNNIKGIGMGVPGAIDSVNGNVDYSNNLIWNDVPIKKMVEEATGLEVKITNDANAATLGEAKFGAGKKYENIIMLTLGTGVGGGIVINNKLYEGKNGKGAELGHMIVEANGYPCTCGMKGCLESYASATGLIRMSKEAMTNNKDSLMWKLVDGDINKVNGRVAWDALKEGDKTAEEVINKYVFYLGTGILNYCNIFRPDAIILSGGIANQGENLTSRLVKFCEERYYGFQRTSKVEIAIAELGYQSGMIGAAALFL